MTCPVKGCTDIVVDGQLLCRFHWFLLAPRRRAEVRRELASLEGHLWARSSLGSEVAREVEGRIADGIRGPFGEGRPTPFPSRV